MAKRLAEHLVMQSLINLLGHTKRWRKCKERHQYKAYSRGGQIRNQWTIANMLSLIELFTGHICVTNGHISYCAASHIISTAHCWSKSSVSSRFSTHRDHLQHTTINSSGFVAARNPIQTAFWTSFVCTILASWICSVKGHLKSSELWGSAASKRNHPPPQVPSPCSACSSSGRLGEVTNMTTLMIQWAAQQGCTLLGNRTEFHGWLILLLTRKLEISLPKSIGTLSQTLNHILSL